MLEVIDLFKTYEARPLLRGVSFSVGAGETVCLLGPSGGGKSTLLRIIAGLEDAEAGRVLWDGHDVTGTPVHQRHFGLMFQDYALFPHRSVEENVAFGLRMQGVAATEIRERVAAALEQVHMQRFARRRVTDLSGGEQQRVALARALAPRPRLLMLDEPLGALDRRLREDLIEELREVLNTSGVPAIYVTHDQEEAFTIADRLILLHDGQVEQQGPPDEVYAHPVSAWSASFFGLNNLLSGKVSGIDPLLVSTPLGTFAPRLDGSGKPNQGDEVQVLLRPYGAVVNQADGLNVVQGMVQDVVYRPDGFFTRLQPEGSQSMAFILPERVEVGQPVTLKIAPEAVTCFCQPGEM